MSCIGVVCRRMTSRLIERPLYAAKKLAFAHHAKYSDDIVCVVARGYLQLDFQECS
jgi:hypothetical protein